MSKCDCSAEVLMGQGFWHQMDCATRESNMSALDVIRHALNEYYKDSVNQKFMVDTLLRQYGDELLAKLAVEIRDACESDHRMTVWDIADMIDPED